MNHPFSPSQTNRTQCGLCKRGAIDHSPYAHCESCAFIGPCNVFDDMLLCDSCANKHEASIKANITDLTENVEKVLDAAKRIDSSIRFSGDIFNAATIAHVEIKAAIMADDSIPQEDKLKTYQNTIFERFQHFQRVAFEQDEVMFLAGKEKAVAVGEQLAAIKTLRDFGNELRDDYRKKLQISDNIYQPLPVKITPKLKNMKTKSPFDLMVEKVAISKNCSFDEAKRILMENMKG